jgi:hypothetical protein
LWCQANNKFLPFLLLLLLLLLSLTFFFETRARIKLYTDDSTSILIMIGADCEQKYMIRLDIHFKNGKNSSRVARGAEIQCVLA